MSGISEERSDHIASEQENLAIRSFYRVKTRYDKTVTFTIRTNVSTEKADRAAQPPYRPDSGHRLQCKQSLQNLYSHDQRWTF